MKGKDRKQQEARRGIQTHEGGGQEAVPSGRFRHSVAVRTGGSLQERREGGGEEEEQGAGQFHPEAESRGARRQAQTWSTWRRQVLVLWRVMVVWWEEPVLTARPGGSGGRMGRGDEPVKLGGLDSAEQGAGASPYLEPCSGTTDGDKSAGHVGP